MQGIRLIVAGRSRYAAGDCFEVFGNGGSGEVSYDAPLTDRPVPFWPGAAPSRGYLFGGHLVAGHVDGVVPDGHLEGVHLLDDHGRPSAPMTFETPEYIFGTFTHAVRVLDAAGNVFGGEPAETTRTINSSPPRPFEFTAAGADEETGQVVFSFSQSV